jgi:LEA14-like dessication related protein
MEKSIQLSLLSIYSLLLLLLVINFNTPSSLEQKKNTFDAQVSQEEGKELIKKAALSFIAPNLDESLKQPVVLIEIDADDFVGFPATCFAPDTDQAVIEAFYQNRAALANSLKIPETSQDSRFSIGNRWSTTASNGGGLGQGDLTTLTWSYVPDGAAIGNGGCGVAGESSAPSNFIAFFNGIYGGPTTPGDYTTAPWHNVFINMFDSWSNASGLTFVYEPNDDGVTVVTGGSGVLGTRGDLRISGHSLDGNSNVLACNYFPTNGDMIIDTSDNFFANSPGLGTTNVLTHEIGHGLGISHVCPITQTKLMEPFVTTAFMGPQEDDILATNRSYGDQEGLNDSAATASFLGANSNPTSYSKLQRSIDDNGDVDYFSFTTIEATLISTTLSPTGSMYLSGVQNSNGLCSAGSSFDALTVSDLMVEVLDTNGVSIIATGNANGLGVSENLLDVGLPIAGTYYIRIRQQGGSVNNVQMYDLSLSLEAGVASDNDVSVSAISAPIALETGLTSTEQLEISLSNLGTLSQTGISYEVKINDVVVATETYNTALASGASVNINVPTLVDLSLFDTYAICVKTLLPSDENTTNDEFCKTTLHLNCIPVTTSGATPCSLDGIKQFVLGTINVDDGGAGCNTGPETSSPVGYANRTELTTDLDRRTGFNNHTLQASTRYSNERIKVWIDLNDNGLFTDAGEEVLNTLFTITDGSLENFSITIPTETTLGTKLLRARAFDASADASNTGPCDDIVYGETQDYTVNIVDPTSVCFGAAITWIDSGWIGGLAPGVADTAIIDGTYDTAAYGSINVCELTVNGTRTLTVDANTYVKTQNNITVNGTLLVSHQGSVVQIGKDAMVINNGTINVDVTTPNLKPRDFIILGNPMSTGKPVGQTNPIFRTVNLTTTNFRPNPLVQAIFPGGTNFVDEDNNDWSQYAGDYNAGEGYYVWPQPDLISGNQTYDLRYSQGTLNNGDIMYSLDFNTTGTGTGTTAMNKNASPSIISNPYASAIDASAFIAANTAIDEIYFWEHVSTPSPLFPGANTANFNMADISTFDGTTFNPASTKPNAIMNNSISTGQGFGVKANASGTATFSNSMRTTSNNNTLRTSETEINRIWLRIQNEQYELGSTTAIAFLDGATSRFEAAYDSRRLGVPVSIYTHILDGSQELGIQGREAFVDTIQVGVGFSSQIDEDATYSISIHQLEGELITEADVFLVDHIAHTVTNLNDTAYSFQSIAGTQNNRFTLEFRSSVLGTSAFDTNSISVFPNPTGGLITINSLQAQISAITITDVQGRIITSFAEQNRNSITLDLSSLKAALYFITISTTQGDIVKRLLKK